MTYQETLTYLYKSTPVFHLQGGAAYKPGFKNTNLLLEALGNPHRKFRTIHVAGTNGKGSTSHLMAATLQKAGYKTGLYTSPHLVDFGERIRINGTMVEQQFVIDFVEKNKKLLEDICPSFFETTMCMAFAYFAEQKIDVAVIEVGLGGRLDSTNVIKPELSIITNIGLDHTEFLGTTLAEIANEKAGIIKPNTPIIIGETQAETTEIFAEKASKENASIIFADQCSIENLPDSDLKGIYQQKNRHTAYIALQKLKELGYNISDEDIKHAFAHTCALTGLQGRWQILQKKPSIICDTGHNEHGMRMTIAQLTSLQYNHLHIIIGFVADKDVDKILDLLPRQASYYFTQANTPRALSSQMLQKQAENFELNGIHFENVKAAYCAALDKANEGDVVFIGGSNFVVGELLSYL